MSWVSDWFDEEVATHALTMLDGVDAMIMGRGTYEYFAPMWPNVPGPHAEKINSMKKYVFSRSATDLGWGNCEFIRGDTHQVVMGLKHTGDGSLTIYGYGALAADLVHYGFVESLEFIVFPLVRGASSSMVREGLGRDLVLKNSRAFSTGALSLNYLVDES